MYEQKNTKQNWIWPVEPSCAKISDPSEMPRFDGKLIFLLFQEVNLKCVHSLILFSHGKSLVRIHRFIV